MLADLRNNGTMPGYFTLVDMANRIVKTLRETNREIRTIERTYIPASVDMNSWSKMIPEVMPTGSRFEVYTIGGTERVAEIDVSFKSKEYVRDKRIRLAFAWDGYEVYLLIVSKASEYIPYD